ncbi:MAG: hypothetical protein DRQ39_08175 [Gammaproteobacteria bacterium]|nr:MAG: hypothetical protein DRQ39_08175 [Gammaproteobacteria bacterium]
MKCAPYDDSIGSSPPKAFFVLRIGHLDKGSQCYSDDALEVTTYMWGRNFPEYALWINDRLYDWPKITDLSLLEDHLKKTLEFDDAFYPPEEFTRQHWWV